MPATHTGAGRAGFLYAGIDEAGYGPLLGPMCSGLAVFRCADGLRAEGPPDLWAALEGVVCRDGPDAGTTRIAVADSKKLKLPNSGARHPLTHLERGVLAFAGATGHHPDHDETLLAMLGVTLEDRPWYAGGPSPVPMATTPDHIRLLSGRLGESLGAAGIEVAEVRACIADEVAFNAMLRDIGDKAGVGMRMVSILATRVWRSESALHDADPPRVVVDRQGGRQRYAGSLAEMFPGAEVTVVAEAGPGSVYDLSRREPGGVRRMRVSFVREGESAHFPIALASMIAKLTRELCMARFNRYWCGRIGELKPTAGYVTDARRWLADVRRLAPDTPEALLRSLCRNA